MSDHRHLITRLYAEVVDYEKELRTEQGRIEKAQEHVSNLMASADTWRRMIAEHRAAIAVLEAAL